MNGTNESLITPAHETWAADTTQSIPAEIAEARPHGTLPHPLGKLKVLVSIRQWPEGPEHHIHAHLGESLRDVMAAGAAAIGIPLLPPPPAEPLDFLRSHHGHHWSEPITDLDKPFWMALVDGVSRHLGIEYRLVIQLNTRWGIAPGATATARQILMSFGLDPVEYSLYRVDAKDPLPPDTALPLHRGDRFEAQKDGRYGAPSSTADCLTLADQVDALKATGLDARIHKEAGQTYVEIANVRVPSPPWSRPAAPILIPVPATYPASGLDAFYLDETVSHAGGAVPYQQGIATLIDRRWRLISWHYTVTRPWNAVTDDLSTHVSHCRGFFLTRGVAR
jgi:hypothetical protein